MNIESFREYCLTKTSVTEDFPFDEDTLAFRVGGKIFALTSLEFRPFRVNLKCDPEWAEQLRLQYEDIIPGYHMNKKHWNSVYLGSARLPLELKQKLVDHSYELVLKSLPKKQQEALK